MIDIKELKKQLQEVINEKQECLRSINQSSGEKYDLLRQKYHVLDDKFWVIQNQLNYYMGELIKEDDEIELKRTGNHLENIYWIYLKGNVNPVGRIDYQGYHKSTIEGDIGYSIFDEHQGHNYAYKALCLLSEYLYENEITDFYISALKSNVISNIIINKYGGDIIMEDDLLTLYQCKTRKMSISQK